MRIAIMGSGGTGGYFGGLLARAGEEVTFIARGSHLEALRMRGLKGEVPARRRIHAVSAGHRHSERGRSRRSDPLLC